VKRPFSTLAMLPQWAMQRPQKPGTLVDAVVLMALPSVSRSQPAAATGAASPDMVPHLHQFSPLNGFTQKVRWALREAPPDRSTPRCKSTERTEEFSMLAKAAA
jgi:hypothetical protein